MAYSLKVSTKQSVYREIEKGVEKYFNQHGFDTISAQFLCGADGKYITAATLKQLYAGLPGATKQVNHDDLSFMADCLMSCDFFINCGSFITIVDITRSISRPVPSFKLRNKLNMMSKRLRRAIKSQLSLKVYCPFKKQYVIKPIQQGLIIGLDYIDSLDFDSILNELDHPKPVRFINFYTGRSI